MKQLCIVMLVALIGGRNCQLFPNVAQTECYSNYLANNPTRSTVIRINNDCSTLDPTDPLAVCSDQGCLDAIDPVFRGICGYDIKSKCSSFSTPSPQQRTCLSNAFNNRASDIFEACGTIDFSSPDSLQQACPNEACLNVGREIYNSCNYDILDLVCGGAAQVLAAPMVIFLFALISMIF